MSSGGGGGGIRRRGAPPLYEAAAKRVRLTQPVSTSQPPPLLLPAAETQLVCTEENPMAAAEDEAEVLLLRCNEVVAMLIHRDEVFASGLLRCKRHALPADLATFFSHIIGSMWIEPADADGKYFLVVPFHKLSFDLHCAGREGHFPVGTDDADIQRSWAQRIIELSEHESSLPGKANHQPQAGIALDAWKLSQPRNYGLQERKDATGSVPFEQVVCTDQNPKAAAEDEAEMLLPPCDEVAMLLHRDEVFASGLLRCKRHALPTDLAAFVSHIIGAAKTPFFPWWYLLWSMVGSRCVWSRTA